LKRGATINRFGGLMNEYGIVLPLEADEPALFQHPACEAAAASEFGAARAWNH